MKKQLNILIQLARMDRDFGHSEKSFIRDFGEHYNIGRSELKEMENNPLYLGDIGEFSLDEKIELLYNAVRLAKVDRKILPNEIVYCQDIASKLGFRKSVVDAMLPLVSDQPLAQVNYASIRRKVSPFL